MTTNGSSTTSTGTAQDDVVLVQVTGDLDISTTERFLAETERRLSVGTVRRVEVDMSRATFVDSTGLGALVELRRAAHALGATTTLLNVDDKTLRLLRVTGLDTVFLGSD